MVINDSVVIIIVALFWLATTLLGDLIGISLVVTICAVAWLFFDHFLWRFIPSIILRQYKIHGFWKGKLSYNYKNKKDTKNVTVAITQTFSKTSICVNSQEMLGESIVSKWNFSKNKLFYVYQTDPKSEFKDKNPVQYGGAQIKINPKNLNKIRIEYWTDRGTKGYMELKKQ